MGARNRTGLVRCALALAVLASAASADGRNPGSVLLFPEFDNTSGRFALLTITNTNPDVSQGSVRVEVVWRNGSGAPETLCSETNATYALTPNDTLTLLSTAANPNAQRGYAYAFAKDVQGRAISFDWLIGDTLLVDGVFALDYAVNPITFGAVTGQGLPTDADGDGLLDLDGVEYEAAPARMLVPRFLGQSTTYTSELVLINLTGGRQFNAMVDFLVYNDNEQVFSRNWIFRCWDKVPLSAISGSFTQTFLASATNHDPAEIVGFPQQESGWFEVNGALAWSSAAQFTDPAIIAVLIENAASGAGADPSFEIGKQTNGALLPDGLLGDPD
jgi:hypothetical protein